MNIVFTGPAKVEGLHIERKHLVALAVEKGHKVQNKVDTTTDILVIGAGIVNKPPSEWTSKVRAAVACVACSQHVKMVSPQQFLELMGYA